VTVAVDTDGDNIHKALNNIPLTFKG
jgi:hypothetical protein